MRGTRAGETADDDRPGDLLLVDLRVAGQEIVDQEPVPQAADEHEVPVHPAVGAEAGVVIEGPEQYPVRLLEQAVAEVVQPSSRLHGLLLEDIEIESHGRRHGSHLGSGLHDLG